MPRRLTQTKKETHQTLKNMSYESMVISWLMFDGWQVFTPILDNGHQTDVLISDGPNYYRIQIKTVEATGEDHLVENRWTDSNVDFVIFFARNSTWGYITPAFIEKKRSLNYPGHARFDSSSRTEFLKEFHKIDLV
ncbi:hypothetical protein ACTWWB_004168 [Vibrio fluvialis]|uniref:hypothetical protein n=1 Tax=Vibrio fluvialis TaxID=676 RepID=UPI001BB08302|nr:hypothetical protein [Vibrio fluvialis]EKO3502145.1 hypothetical protein [Vibrio fluvialis]EKO3971883.1 hypothetical protein [Vibrio fluvialis]EKZ9003174.1 hypothetical protein [Vibrio fluvialis]ELI1831906.1 hypothetical protein [Vibrio fluvialis]QUF70863.1 hypothetical protein KC397_21405 [Vibrio fluvialis]